MHFAQPYSTNCRVVLNSGHLTGPANTFKKEGGRSRGRKENELLIPRKMPV